MIRRGCRFLLRAVEPQTRWLGLRWQRPRLVGARPTADRLPRRAGVTACRFASICAADLPRWETFVRGV